VAWNLRRLRAARGVSQESLAADTGIDRAYLSALETGQGNATVDLLERISRSLDTGLHEFFETPQPGAERPKPLPAGRRAKIDRPRAAGRSDAA
jgi:transcriptional regulator with XRE-family HTH domain